jgi:hypothetical protein
MGWSRVKGSAEFGPLPRFRAFDLGKPRFLLGLSFKNGSSPGVRLLVGTPHVIGGEVSIYLGGPDVGVAEQRLHAAQIGAPFE